jgi:hypothetical protein
MAMEKLADQITKLMNGSLDSERLLTLQVSEFFQCEFCESLSGKVPGIHRRYKIQVRALYPAAMKLSRFSADFRR